MKRFVLHIAGLLLGMLLIMVVLDMAYTKVFETSPPRTKFQYLRSMKNQHLDYAFLGSSRVENGINPNIIKTETGKHGVNLGFKASKLRDVYTILQLLKTYNIQSDRLFIQIDYIYNMDGFSNLQQYQILPFLRENEIIRNYVRKNGNYFALYYVPFYRYCINDYRIGLREVVMNLTHKKTTINRNAGYNPLIAAFKDEKRSLPKHINVKSTDFDSIAIYCTKNNIKPVFFCAPFYKSAGNIDYIEKLKTKVPGLKDYSTLVKSRSLFKDCYHLNDSGASFFTRYLITDMELK